MVPINYLAVGLAGILAIVLGALWYGPLFGSKWKAYMGLTDESMKSMTLSPLQAMVGGALVSIVMAYVLAHSLVFASAYLGATGISAGLTAAF
jgi:hypothetical protein